MLKNKERKASAVAGFSLIELSVVIIISGLLFAAAVQVYQISLLNKHYIETDANVAMVRDAINEFLGLKGRYPCPADPSLSPGDLNYGVEQCRADIADPCPYAGGCIPTAPAVSAVGGRDTDGDGNNDPIMIGSVPIRTLQENSARRVLLQDVHVVDGFGMKISYAVSELMTDIAATIIEPVDVDIGAINIQDEYNQSVVSPEASAHFIVFSHGQGTVGAYPLYGNAPVESCIVPSTLLPPTPGYSPGTAPGDIKTDLENCDNNDAFFVSGLRALADTDDYFDDVVYFTAAAGWPLWMNSPYSPTDDLSTPAVDESEVWIYNTNRGFVGAGEDAPASKLHTQGNIRTDADMKSEQGFCDYTGLPAAPGDECLQPSFIAGDVGAGTGGDECPSGQVAVGIQNNQLVCEPLLTSGFSISCPLGPPPQFVTGFTVTSDPGTGARTVTPNCALP